MKKVLLGKSGIEVSALCLGTDLYGSKRDQATSFQLLDFFRGAGGTFVDGPDVVDGNLVTGRAWPDHPQWFRQFMEQLRRTAPVG